MKVYDYPNVDLPEGSRPVVTLGNFDGVHRGHQRAMALLTERARDLHVPAVAVTFEPHPVSVLRPEQAPERILTPALKVELLAEQRIDLLVVIHFTPDFSLIEPEAFVEDVLVEKLRASELVLGGNFRFGRGRAGDLERLRALGERFGFIVHEVEASSHRGSMISSSRIRETLADGDVEEAASMLGRPFFLTGTVVAGDGRGKPMGFPTANIETTCDILVGDGVFVTEAQVDGKMVHGMTHVGRRPTFGLDERTVETHLFDFDTDIYGAETRLYFHRRVRGTVAFGSAEQLKEQLERDREQAQRFFRARGRNLVL